MNWTQINMYEGEFTIWISGIYKIVNYDDPSVFYAYFITEVQNNWGDLVCVPPVRSVLGYRCWPSLESAQASCEQHKHTHVPCARVVKRAEEIKRALMIEHKAA